MDVNLMSDLALLEPVDAVPSKYLAIALLSLKEGRFLTML